MYKYVIKTFKKIEGQYENSLQESSGIDYHLEFSSRENDATSSASFPYLNQKSEQTGMLQKQVPARIIHVKRKRLPKKDNVVRICLVDQLIMRTELATDDW